MEHNDNEPIHSWFGLTYASYLVLPRSVLQSLPLEIQETVVKALEAVDEHLYPAPVPVDGQYLVQLRGKNGRFVRDPLCDYDRGRRRMGKSELLNLSERHSP